MHRYFKATSDDEGDFVVYRRAGPSTSYWIVPGTYKDVD